MSLSSLTAISQHPRLHDIQESHNYTDCMPVFDPAVVPYLRLWQAYGEVLWFGGRVTGLTLVSFFFMVRYWTRMLIAYGAKCTYAGNIFDYRRHGRCFNRW